MRPKNYWILLAFPLLTLYSCGNYNKVKKSSDVNYKLSRANDYFDKKDYQKANELYKDLLPIMKNTRNYESLFYHYAYTFYYLKDYVEASYYFKNFTEYFPASKSAEECEFMSAVCLYKYAPKYTLDQTNTEKALETLQSYVNRFPKSEHAKEANDYIDLSKKKLELKEADAAKLYYNIYQYKAATVAYKSVLRDFPDSPNADLYQLMIMRSFFKYAKNSIATRQEERYQNVISGFRELKDTYPHSQYLAEAQKLSDQAQNNINKIRSNEQPH
jgi:outer membrane protein assembly factor BamD